MEKIIKIIEKKYNNEIKNNENNISKEDKIYLFDINDLLKKKDNYQGEELSLNFSNMEIGNMIQIINNSFTLKQSYFNNMLYKSLKEKDFLKLIEGIKIPSSNQAKIISYIQKLEGQLKNKIWENFIKINSNSLTEDIIIKLIKLIDLNNLLQLIIEEVEIDSNYALQLMKENDNYFFENEDVIKINKAINSTENIKYGWIEFLKNINLISLLKQKINKSDYEKYEQLLQDKNNKLNQKKEKENLKSINLKDDIDLTLINKFTTTNKNQIIREKITI